MVWYKLVVYCIRDCMYECVYLIKIVIGNFKVEF